MQTIGIIEANTKLPQLCEEVYVTKKPIVITRSGRPFVRIEAVSSISQPMSAIWERRNTFIQQHGEWSVEFELPQRMASQEEDNPFGANA